MYQPTYQVERKPRHGLAIAGFVCALVGVVVGIGPAIGFMFTFILAVLGFIFGGLGFHHKLGKWAIGLSVVAVAFGIWQATTVNKAVDDLNTEFQKIDNYSDCINQAKNIDEMTACDQIYGR
jgi:4-amino-4-deoxy-L-arabinose transferase-like glycosyltransferase